MDTEIFNFYQNGPLSIKKSIYSCVLILWRRVSSLQFLSVKITSYSCTAFFNSMVLSKTFHYKKGVVAERIRHWTHNPGIVNSSSDGGWMKTVDVTGIWLRKGDCIWKSNFATSLHVFSNFEMILTTFLISNTFGNQQWHKP